MNQLASASTIIRRSIYIFWAASDPCCITLSNQVLLNAQASKLAPLPAAPVKETKLAITPNYIKNPPVAYQVVSIVCSTSVIFMRLSNVLPQVDLSEKETPVVVEKKARVETMEVQPRWTFHSTQHAVFRIITSLAKRQGSPRRSRNFIPFFRRVSAVVAKPIIQQQQSQEVILKVSGMRRWFFVDKF